jgi:hypothetical protein
MQTGHHILFDTDDAEETPSLTSPLLPPPPLHSWFSEGTIEDGSGSGSNSTTITDTSGSGSESDTQPLDDAWKGYVYGGSLAVTTILAAAFRLKSTESALVAGLRIRSALCALAFQRAEQLDWGSVSARSSSAVVAGDSGFRGKGGHDGSSVTTATEATAGDGTANSDSSRSGGDAPEVMLGADAVTAPLGRVSELMGRSAEHVLHYYDAAINVMLLPVEIVATVVRVFFGGSECLCSRCHISPLPPQHLLRR